MVLDPGTGAELARLTNDSNSFAPVWSPDGDQIAFLHRQGLGVDLEIMTLTIDTGGITLVDTKPVTQDGSWTRRPRPHGSSRWTSAHRRPSRRPRRPICRRTCPAEPP